MKKTIATLFFLSFYTAIFAQESIDSIVLNMPDEIIFGLQTSQKEFLLTNPDDSAQIKVATNLYPQLTRSSFSKDYIRIKTSAAGDVQIKLLPLINNSKIVCVVKTVCGQICDSRIQFYTTNWQPIDSSTLFPEISIERFINTESDHENSSYKNAVSELDISPMKITLSANDDNATVEYDIKQYLSKEDYKIVEPYLTNKPIILSWDKRSFKEK